MGLDKRGEAITCSTSDQKFGGANRRLGPKRGGEILEVTHARSPTTQTFGKGGLIKKGGGRPPNNKTRMATVIRKKGGGSEDPWTRRGRPAQKTEVCHQLIQLTEEKRTRREKGKGRGGSVGKGEGGVFWA